MMTHSPEQSAARHLHALHGLAVLLLTTLLLLAVCPSSSAVNARVPDATAADTIDQATLALGARVYQGSAGGAFCTTCHGRDGKGGPGIAPDLTDATWLHGDGSRAFIERIVRSGVMKPIKQGAPMPPMGGGSLSDAQVKAVAAYVESLSAKARPSP